MTYRDCKYHEKKVEKDSPEDFVDGSTQEIEDYIKKTKERLITVANNIIGNISKDLEAAQTSKQKWEKTKRGTNHLILLKTQWKMIATLVLWRM